MTGSASQASATSGPAVDQGRWPTGRRPMSLGLMLPISERGGTDHDVEGISFSELLNIARLAAEIGFEALWLPDHFAFKMEQEGGAVRGIRECWTTTAAVAASIDDVTIGALVACTSFHNPGSIAKMADNVDEISGGRFILGLGCGWHQPEYEMFGLPFDHRVDRFEEAMQIISPLLRDGAAHVDGHYYQARHAVNLPRGPRWREGGPPIMIGAKQPRMMRLTATYADIWNSDWYREPAEVARQMAALDAACRDVGRDPAGLVRTAGSNFALDGATGRRPDPITGDADAMAAAIRGFAALDLKHYVCGLDPCTPASLEQFAKVIQALDRG